MSRDRSQGGPGAPDPGNDFAGWVSVHGTPGKKVITAIVRCDVATATLKACLEIDGVVTKSEEIPMVKDGEVTHTETVTTPGRAMLKMYTKEAGGDKLLVGGGGMVEAIGR